MLEARNPHYVLIKDFNRFMTNKTKHGKKTFLSILRKMLQNLKILEKLIKTICELVVQNKFHYLQKIQKLISEILKDN